MIFAVEPLASCWDEIMELASAHWLETESYRHNQPFAPSFDRYVSYDKAGWLMQVTARDQGRLVGYATMYVTPSMHSQSMIATEDTYFLLPEYRKGRNAIQLLDFTERECARRGAVEITMTSKLTNKAGRILELRGYEMVAQQWSKRLSPAQG